MATGHVGSFWKPDPVPHHYEHRLAYDEVPPGSHQLCFFSSDDDFGQDDYNDCDDHDDVTKKTIETIGRTFPPWQITTMEGIRLRW